MKKILLVLSVFIFSVAAEVSYAQAVKNSWSFGFGFTYPRFLSTDVRPQEENYGGFLSIQRNFTENVGLRLLANYSHMKGRIGGFDPALDRYYYTNGAKVPSLTEFMHSDVISGNFDLLYYFVPCSPVLPYAGIGLGVASLSPTWPSNVVNAQAKSKVTAEFNLILGSEWRLSDAWNLKTEFGLHSTAGQLDGVINNNRQGIFGSDADAYMTFNVGLQYYFKKGEPSKYCDLYNGIKVDVPQQNYPTLDQIEDLIKKYIPKEVEKQVVVEKQVPGKCNWVLYGVNFEFNKSTLLLESYPILQHAVEILKNNPDLKVEIQGYTDNIGSKEYNQKLSERRAKTVKDYLIKKGIESGRLTSVGFGEANPVGDNSTAVGRAENRRIEFKTQK